MRTLAPLFIAALAGVAFAAEIPFSEPVLGAAPRSQYSATAASDGDGFLAIWVDQRAWPPATMATRVARDGRVLDETGIRIASYAIHSPLVIWSDTAYVVAWGTSDGRMWVMRINREGEIIDGPRELAQRGSPTSIAKSSSHVAIAFLRSDEPHALLLTPDTQSVKEVKLGNAAYTSAPRIASNGTQFAAGWVAFGQTSVSVTEVRFDTSGLMIGAPSIASASSNARSVAVASDGTNFLLLPREDFTQASLLWTGAHYVMIEERGANVTAMRFDRSGNAIDAQATVLENVETIGSAPAPLAATNGRELFVTWTSTPDGDGSDVHGAIIDSASLTRVSRELLSKAAPRQLDPVVASNGRNVLTLWRELSGVYVRRSALDGQALDAEPLRITTRALQATAVAHGSDYLVVWREDDEIVTRRIAATGELRASGGGRFNVHYPYELAAASNGTTALLAWTDGDSLQAVRVDADGAFVDSVPVTIAEMSIGRVAIASNGSDFLVTWGETATTLDDSSIPVSVRAARVTSSLTVLDPDGFFVAASEANEGDPAVTWNGSLWLVAWHWELAGDHEVRIGRVTTQGFALDCDLRNYGVTVVRDAQSPSIAWDGTRIRLAWRAAALGDVARAVYVASLAEHNAPLEATRTLGDAEIFARAVSFATLAGGVVATAYERIAREPASGGVSRAFLDLEITKRRRRAS